MKNYQVFLLVVFTLALLDRLKEIIDFKNWYNKSMFSKIKNRFWFKWFRSNDSDEHRKLWKWLPLHPIFYDGYHNFKNISVLIIIISLWYFSGIHWMYMIYGALLWYIIQKLTYKIFVN